MVSGGMLSLEGEEQRVRCKRLHGASSRDLCGNLPPYCLLVESHVVLLIPRPSAVGLICLENWEQGAVCTNIFLLNFNMPYLRGLVSAVSSQN